MNDIEITIMYEVPGLPYSRTYARWTEHVDSCGECKTALESAVSLDPAGVILPLCFQGAKIDAGMQEVIHFQRETSQLN